MEESRSEICFRMMTAANEERADQPLAFANMGRLSP